MNNDEERDITRENLDRLVAGYKHIGEKIYSLDDREDMSRALSILESNLLGLKGFLVKMHEIQEATYRKGDLK